jgi:flagellar hook-associated protein 3 FlgL
MRISTYQLHKQGIDSLLTNQVRVSRTQLELASGKKLITPSDDPAGAEQVLNLKEVLATLEQYGKNAEAARSRLGLEDTMLAQTTEVLQRVRELAVAGLNDTAGDAGRDGIALEVRQRLSDLLAYANSKDQNGDYLFSGYYKGAAEPIVDSGGGNYVYNGDQGQRLVQISATRQIADGDHGDDVFMRIQTGSGVQSLFDIVNDLATALEANSPSQASLNDLDAALDNIVTVRARVGARLNAIEDELSAHEALSLNLQETLSGVEDLDYAEAVARLNRELTGLQAAQQTYVKVQQLSLFDYL